MSVSSSNAVELAVHDLGGDGPDLLISHATGFHGRCYIPVAAALADRRHSIAFDYRGHGDSRMPAGLAVDWERYGDDALAMAQALRQPVDAFGHSMGGACLLMAAHREPGLFRRIVVFEPIVFPADDTRDPNTPSPLVAGARRRRSSFPSYEDAIANYAAKLPLARFTPEALNAYVRFGFAPGEDGQVHLKCLPETEASTFEAGPNHITWDALPAIDVPVLVIAGHVEESQPSRIASGVAERLPRGEYLELDDLDHFAPMTHPARIADLIDGFLDRT